MRARFQWTEIVTEVDVGTAARSEAACVRVSGDIERQPYVIHKLLHGPF